MGGQAHHGLTMSYTYSPIELKLRSQCGLGFKVVPFELGSKPWLAPTGEPFVELINPDKLRLSDDDECYRVALATFGKYANKRGDTLYWRTYPEIKDGAFYMRVLVTDLPPLANHEQVR